MAKSDRSTGNKHIAAAAQPPKSVVVDLVAQFFCYWQQRDHPVDSEASYQQDLLVGTTPKAHLRYTGKELSRRDIGVLALLLSEATQHAPKRVVPFTAPDLIEQLKCKVGLECSFRELMQSIQKLLTATLTYATADGRQEYACSPCYGDVRRRAGDEHKPYQLELGPLLVAAVLRGSGVNRRKLSGRG
jgi:hypothetical protein